MCQGMAVWWMKSDIWCERQGRVLIIKKRVQKYRVPDMKAKGGLYHDVAIPTVL